MDILMLKHEPKRAKKYNNQIYIIATSFFLFPKGKKEKKMNRTFFMRHMMEKSASSPSPKWLFSVSGSKNPPPIFSVNRQIAVTMEPRHFHEIFAANGAQRAKKPMKGKIRARKKASKSCSQGTQSSTQECERALESCACLAVEHKTQLRARARDHFALLRGSIQQVADIGFHLKVIEPFSKSLHS